MAIAYSYIRFSSKRQELGHSLKRQQEAVERYCRENDLSLDESLSFEDLGVSGFTGAHRDAESGLGQFIEACQQGLIETTPRGTLLVENLDRLSREKINTALKQFLNILEYVDIVTLSDGKRYTDNSDPMEIVISITYMARAHDESKRKSDFGKDNWTRKRENASNKKLSKNTPFWLTLNDDYETFQVHQDKVELVKRVFDLSINGYGQAKIAETLNQEGITSAQGRAWNVSSVRYLLTDKASLGHYQPHQKVDGKRQPIGDVITDYYPQIISDEVYYQSVNARESRKNSGSAKGGRKGQRMSNVLQNLCTCGKCGAPINYVSKGKARGLNYLVCSRAKRGLGCDYTSYRYDDVFKVVYYHTTKTAITKYWNEATPAIDNIKRVEAIQGEIVEAKKQYAAFMSMDLDFMDTITINKTKSLQDKVKELELTLEEAQKQTGGKVINLEVIEELVGKIDDSVEARIALNQKMIQLLPNGVILTNTGKREGHKVIIPDADVEQQLKTGKAIGKTRTKRHLNDGRS